MIGKETISQKKVREREIEGVEPMVLGQAKEDYLETIYVLKKTAGWARCSEVAYYMKRSRPTVTVAIRQLEEAGYVCRDKNTFLSLTEKGNELALAIYERHCFIRDFLISIGTSPEIADHDACQIEHVLSEESYEKWKMYVRKE